MVGIGFLQDLGRLRGRGPGSVGPGQERDQQQGQRRIPDTAESPPPPLPPGEGGRRPGEGGYASPHQKRPGHVVGDVATLTPGPSPGGRGEADGAPVIGRIRSSLSPRERVAEGRVRVLTRRRGQNRSEGVGRIANLPDESGRGPTRTRAAHLPPGYPGLTGPTRDREGPRRSRLEVSSPPGKAPGPQAVASRRNPKPEPGRPPLGVRRLADALAPGAGSGHSDVQTPHPLPSPEWVRSARHPIASCPSILIGRDRENLDPRAARDRLESGDDILPELPISHVDDRPGLKDTERPVPSIGMPNPPDFEPSQVTHGVVPASSSSIAGASRPS